MKGNWTTRMERIERLQYECLPSWRPKVSHVFRRDWHRQRRQGRQFCRLVKGVNDANSSH